MERRTKIYSQTYIGYVDEMTTTQLSALKKKDLKTWERVIEIRSKLPKVEVTEE